MFLTVIETEGFFTGGSIGREIHISVTEDGAIF